MKLEISKSNYPLLDIHVRIKDTFLHVDPLGLQIVLIVYVVNNFDVSSKKRKCNL